MDCFNMSCGGDSGGKKKMCMCQRERERLIFV
jgi:hypothetical protein